VTEQLRGVLGVQPATLEAGHPAFDHQQRKPRRLLVRIGLRDDDHEIGVDPEGAGRPGAVEAEMVAVP
jgi:hypothetical protein